MACAAHKRVGNYWYMLPEYGQARKSMWDAVNPHSGKRRVDEAFPELLRRVTREQEMMIVFKNGSTFQLVGADNFNSLVGSPPVGLVFSEFALTAPAAWGYLSPILMENGGWALFNSTPRGDNHFKALCDYAGRADGWFYQLLTADDTGLFSQQQLGEKLGELQALHGDDYGLGLWRQEYYCSFDAAIMGAIWGDCVVRAESEGRIVRGGKEDLAWAGLPVHTGWDLGFTDDTAVWFFQVGGNEVRVVDYYEANGKDIAHYAEVLRARGKERGWEYGTHWLPHDARPRTLAAGGKSILQQMKEAEVGRIAIAPRLDREEGIQAVRATFPKTRWDGDRCAVGLKALKAYHREWDEDRKAYSMTPRHDWSSHAADAMRTVGVVWKIPAPKAEREGVLSALDKTRLGAQRFGEFRDRFLAGKRAERELRMEE